MVFQGVDFLFLGFFLGILDQIIWFYRVVTSGCLKKRLICSFIIIHYYTYIYMCVFCFVLMFKNSKKMWYIFSCIFICLSYGFLVCFCPIVFIWFVYVFALKPCFSSSIGFL